MTPTIVLFGAGGDLAARLVLPAIRNQPEPVQVVGADVRGDVDVRADVTSASDVSVVLDRAGSAPFTVYLALPTQLMLPAVLNLATYGLPPGSRVAIEKPFGHDGASAAALTEACRSLPDVYRVDHFLAMSGVRQLPALTSEWSSRTVARLDLLFDETLALEGRASFYDRAGALRDVVQNHLLAVLATLAADHAADDIAQSRVKALRAVEPVDVARARRGRYDGYLDEAGVDPSRRTETFAEFTLYLHSPQWTGTRFVLRAGKALDARRRGVVAHPRPGVTLDHTWLDFDQPEPDGTGAEPRAYERIIADLLAGASTYAIAADEAQESWRIVDPILEAWAADETPMQTYLPGSAGPV